MVENHYEACFKANFRTTVVGKNVQKWRQETSFITLSTKSLMLFNYDLAHYKVGRRRCLLFGVKNYRREGFRKKIWEEMAPQIDWKVELSIILTEGVRAAQLRSVNHGCPYR